MAETGFDAIVKEAVSRNCACCLSTPIKDASDFLANGFCVIPLSGGKAEQDQLAAEVAAWGDEVVTYFHALMKTYECQAEFNAATPSLESGYSNFRQRGPGRFEIIAEFITDKVVPLLANAKDVQDTLTYLLCNPLMEVEKKLMSSGCFLSLTGSETQNYHTDGPALSDVVDLFPYAVNVFVPLVAVDSRNGTEFIPGSHVVGEHKKVKSVRPSVALRFSSIIVLFTVDFATRESTPDLATMQPTRKAGTRISITLAKPATSVSSTSTQVFSSPAASE